MELITNVLYWISTGLMIPVTILLLYFLIYSIIMIGGFYGNHISRKKINVRINRDIENNTVNDVLCNLSSVNAQDSLLINTLERIKSSTTHAKMDKVIGDYEIDADKEISKSKLLVKIGPMLGLMGTLIPMGPALVGLATGDVASMASNMQVAFATTVVGIIIGAIGFVTLQVKQRWVADDLNIIEYIVKTKKAQ